VESAEAAFAGLVATKIEMDEKDWQSWLLFAVGMPSWTKNKECALRVQAT
jgi:hypothetical protein